MRITGGYLRSRKLDKKIPSGVRPSTDQSRETLFNILNNLVNLDGAKFLDLFAGSGIVGIEALSRGAEVIFIDKSYKSSNLIHKNLSILKVKDFILKKMDSISFLNQKSKFDIIFIDPPYDTMMYEKSLKSIIANENLEEKGIVILELRANRSVDLSGFDVIKEKEVSSSKFMFLELP